METKKKNICTGKGSVKKKPVGRGVPGEKWQKKKKKKCVPFTTSVWFLTCHPLIPTVYLFNAMSCQHVTSDMYI